MIGKVNPARSDAGRILRFLKILSHKDACHPLSISYFLHATIAILHDIQSLGWSRQSLTIY